MHEWENQGTSNEKGISENYQSIEWTRVRTAALHDLYEAAPLGIILNKYIYFFKFFIIRKKKFQIGISKLF